MKIKAPKGMRDFYPEDMRRQNWLFDAWRRASRAFGFEEYEGPIFEDLALYTLKSGEGIVSEIFHFESRGGDHFAIRPEMTPTLARMVAARANAMPAPIKWFSLPRMCRAERPQRGRLREFFQWNADILGVEDPLADAEIIALAVEFFRSVGLTAEDVVIRVNSRRLAAAALTSLGIAPERHEQAFALIDRHERLPADVFDTMWTEAFGESPSAGRLTEFLKTSSREETLRLARESGEAGAAAADQFDELWTRLDEFGVSDWRAFDLRIVRGLAYYTGIVFEAHTRGGELRALLGGGRYDDLTGLLDGPRVPGVGFGMGDAPVFEALKSLDKLPTPGESLDVFLIDADAALFPQVLRIAGELRQTGLRVDFSYKRAAIGKQFRQADARGAQVAIVVGAELAARGELTVKHLASGAQRGVSTNELRDDAWKALGLKPA
ncbi:MAG: histidine--tRNA ligase [Phycisphaerales bacterium]|nr:histidine--tRNA ligase [Phycisphaerales bacterium]